MRSRRLPAATVGRHARVADGGKRKGVSPCPRVPDPRSRAKRQADEHVKNTCPLLLVADHRFFTHMGHGEESTTLNYLVSPASAPAPPPPPAR